MVFGRYEMHAWPIWLGVGLFSFLISVIAVLVYSTRKAGDAWRPEWGNDTRPSLEWVAGVTKIEFPMGARLIASRHIPAYRGGTMWAKVRIAKVDAEELIDSLPPGFMKSSTSRLGVTRQYCCPGFDAPFWWNPDSSRKFIAASLIEFGSIHKVLINTSDSKLAIVYIYWHEGLQ